MTVKTVVTFQDLTETSKIKLEDRELLDVLGDREEAVAVQLGELLESVTESLRGALEHEGELTLEINGALDVKTAAGVKYLFFNAGADVTKHNTMKVTLKTKVMPGS